jgi:hypothetical protein
MANAVDFKFEGSKLVVNVDPNSDGQVVLSVTIDLAEVADEVLAALKK